MSSTSLLALVARCRALCRPRSQAPDAELLARFARQRDAAAFEELLERYAPLVWGICRRIAVSEADGEDAFQAVFLALIRQAGRLDGRQPLGGWLHTVAVRVAGKAASRARRQAERQFSPLPNGRGSEPSTSGDVADEVASRELFHMVDEEVERLPANLRVAVILCCLQGRTRDEAAEILGCSVAAVKSRLERGRDLLRHRLEQRGVQLPAALLALSLTGTRIRACLWAKTMQAALYTPAPAIAALAEAALPALTVGKGKLLVAASLLMLTSAAGVTGRMMTAKSPQTPAAIPSQAKATAESKKPTTPHVRTDRYGDPLPDGALARLGTVRWRHGDFALALAYSPDGKKIVTTGVGRALVLWDAATGKELRVFSSRGQPRGVAFSPDGKLIATTLRTGQLWDAASGKMVRELKNVQTGLSALAFAPDSKTLATAHYDGTLRLWEVISGAEKCCLHRGQGALFSLAYAPDGKLLASGGSDGTIRLWDSATGKEVRRIINSKKEIASVVFSPDGKQLAAGSNEESLHVWDVATGRQIRAFGGKQKGYTPISISPDGKLLAEGYGNGNFRLWDIASGEEKRHWHTGIGWARSLAFSPDGKTLATTVLWDGGIRLWDVESGRERFAVESHHGPIPLLRFGPDKKTLMSAGFDRRLMEWDLATQTPRRSFAWTTGSFAGFALSPDSKTVAAGDHYETFEVWLWDIATGKASKLPGKHEGRIQTVAFSPDGRLVASGGNDKAIHIWDVRTGKEVRQFKGAELPNLVNGLLFSPDGKMLACVTRSNRNESGMQLWDVASGKENHIFAKVFGETPAAFSPDGNVLATTNDPSGGKAEALVRLWDLATGKELSHHRGHRSSVGPTAFSPNGKLVVSGGGDEDNSIHVWEAATGRLIRRFEGHHSWVSAVTFAADGLTVASSAGDSTILLWDITGRQQDGKLSPIVLTPRQLDACWTALANEDVAKAYDAVWSFVAAGEQAVPFLQKHRPPVPRPDAKVVSRLLADLDSNIFSVRDKATEELSKLGDAAAPALQRALQDKPSLEMRRRLQQLLDQSRDWTAERLRVHRAIQALEHMSIRRAKEVLQALAAGAPQSRRTEEAKAALRRMAR